MSTLHSHSNLMKWILPLSSLFDNKEAKAEEVKKLAQGHRASSGGLEFETSSVVHNHYTALSTKNY